MKFSLLWAGLFVFCLSISPSFAGNPIDGKAIWIKHNCSVCHGVDGNATMTGTPNFARGERMNKPDKILMLAVLKGNDIMPGMRGILRERDVADVVSFIRTLRKF